MKSLPMSLSACFLLGVAPTPSTGEGGQSTEMQEWHGQNGGEATSGAEVITNATQWTLVWQRQRKPVPPVDFAHHFAVVAFAGQRPTGGFTLEFQSHLSLGHDLLIRWRIRPPAPDASVTQALTQPWAVKVFRRPKGNINVEQVED